MLNFLTFIYLIFTSFLITSTSNAGGEQPPPPSDKNFSVASKNTFPKEYIVPRHKKTDSPEKIREFKSCSEYLTICERSCADRGDMFKFACIGQDFQPFEDHSRCTCADDLFARREVLTKQVIIKGNDK